MKRFFTKKKIILGVVILVAVVIGIKMRNGQNGKEYLTATTGSVVQEIVVTGKVKADNNVDLGFDRTGRVVRSYKQVGDTVRQGEVIAELDISSELASLAKEKASLAEERATLGGSRESLASSIREGFASADNAVRNKADQFFKQPRTNPVFEVKFTDGNYVHYFNVPSDLSIEINGKRRDVEAELVLWQNELLTLTDQNAEVYADRAVARMNKISDFLDTMAYAVNSFTSADFAYESTVAGYKTAIDSARSAVSTSRTSIINTKESVSQIGSVGSVGQARIDQINASIAGIEASINKSKIIAPFAGTITLQDAKVGSIAPAGSRLVSIISEGQISIEANISEVNIGKVQVGNKVRIEFDSFPSDVFEGEVVYIEPGETLVDGVVNYKTRVSVKPDSRLKSGMTGNLNIETARKDGVVTLPSYALIKEGDKTFVNKFDGTATTKVEVKTGIMGSDGLSEIVAGLEAGDTVEYASGN